MKEAGQKEAGESKRFSHFKDENNRRCLPDGRKGEKDEEEESVTERRREYIDLRTDLGER